MITLTRDEAQQVLDSITNPFVFMADMSAVDARAKAIETLRTRLAQPVIIDKEPTKLLLIPELMEKAGWVIKKEWVGLTDEEVMSLLPGAVRLPPGWSETVRAIEAKLKEKNTCE